MVRHRHIIPLLALILATSTMAATKHKPAMKVVVSATALADQLIVKRNFKSAFDVLLNAAEAGDAKAMAKLANAYRYGLGTSPSQTAAYEWYQKAAMAGNKEAALVLEQKRETAPPTKKKIAIDTDSANPKQNVDYAHLPERSKDSADWASIAAAQKNHAALQALNSGATGNVQLIQASLGDSEGLLAFQTTTRNVDPLGRSALMLAIDKNNKPEAITALLAAKPDFTITDKQGFTAAGIAAGHCDSENLNQLAKAGDNLKGGKIPPVVAAAAACENWSPLKGIFAKVDLNAQDFQGRNAAFYAAAKGNLALLRWLADNGANLGLADKQGLTPLHSAAQNKQVLAFIFILNRTENIDVKSIRGVTPLMFAANSGCTECITAALAAKPNLDLKNADGDTALMIAVRSLQGKTAQLLSDSGASQMAKNNAGDTPSKLATRLGMMRP